MHWYRKFVWKWQRYPYVGVIYVARNFSLLHHYGPSTSFASQSSLGIILENSAIENHLQRNQRSHSLKNRNEYEQLDGDYYVDDDDDDADADDDPNGGSSSSYNSTKNADNINKFGTPKGTRGWRNVRAVMAYYYTLRKIKRNGALSILISLAYIYIYNCILSI